MYYVAGAVIILVLAVSFSSTNNSDFPWSSLEYRLLSIDPCPSFEIEKVELPSPDKTDPLLIDVEHVLKDYVAPEDGFLLDDDNNNNIWIWSMGNGDLLKVDMNTMTGVTFAHTGENHKDCGEFHMEPRCGRPLGMLKLYTDEDRSRYQSYLNNDEAPLCLVADAYKGLLLVSTKGKIVTLLTDVAGQKLFFANAIVQAQDGTIYLSDSSSRWRRNEVLIELLESQPTGRVISWVPETGISNVIVDILPFPNGLALRNDDQSLLIALTTRHQIVRVDLSMKNDDGEKKVELFAALPGLPDNIHVTYVDEWKKSVLWVGTATKSSAITHLLNWYPMLRKILATLPRNILMKCFKRYGLLLALDAESGKILHAYQDPTGTTTYIAGIHFDKKYAYIGSWMNPFIAKITKEKLFSVQVQ
jgi:sugar lactone lactonase YvrE